MDRLLEYLLIICILLIMYIDINKKYIPNFLNIALFIICIFIKRENFSDFFLGSAIFSLPILLFYGYVSDLLKKEAIGFGDIKLISALGGLIFRNDFNYFLQIYIFYFLIFASASLFILLLFIYKFFRNKHFNFRNSELAFAPFICIISIVLYKFPYDFYWRFLWKNRLIRI